MIRMLKCVKKSAKKLLSKATYSFRRLDYEKEIEKRSKLSIFDYMELSKDMDLVTKEYGWNAYYGLDYIVKNVIGLPVNCILEDTAIEHGILRYNEVTDVTTDKNIIFAFGLKRMVYFQNKYPRKRVYSVGTYIQYVDSFMSTEEIRSIRAEFGKTLLVFTSHSIPGEKVEFDVEAYIKEIERVKKENGFDTVLVSLHWKDIQTYAAYKSYENMGYKICTAGNLYDTNFLKRLKSMFELADMVMGNDTGSYLGYSIACNKPFYLYYIKPHSTFYVENAEKNYDMEYYKEFIGRAQDAFGEYQERVTSNQLEFVEDYWGYLKKGLFTANELKDYCNRSM